MTTISSVQVGFGFVHEDDQDPKMWVDLSVNGVSILMSPQLARKIADQLYDFADYVDNPDDGEEVDEEEPQLELNLVTKRFDGSKIHEANIPKAA